MRRNRILVTGASGFIGRRIVEIAAAREPFNDAFDCIFTARGTHTVAGQIVNALDFAESTDRQLGQFMHAERPTHLLHAGWYTGDGFYNSPENLSWLSHSVRLFRAFLESGGRAITTAGSCAEYAPSGGVLREEARTSDASLYAAAKNALHRVQDAACAQFGARSAWGRLSFVYGPDEPARKLLRSTAENLVAGRSVTVREPHKRADFLHAHDAARALLLLAATEGAAGSYNLCSGQAPALGTIILQLRDLCHSRSDIIMGESAASDMLLSSDRLRMLGFRASVPLVDGLAEMAAAARMAHAGNGIAQSL